MIFMYAILLYGQFLACMQPYVTIYDLVVYDLGGQPGIATFLLVDSRGLNFAIV